MTASGATLAAVSFSLDPSAVSVVRASIDGRSWHQCVSSTRAHCSLSGMRVADVRTLRVVAIA